MKKVYATIIAATLVFNSYSQEKNIWGDAPPPTASKQIPADKVTVTSSSSKTITQEEYNYVSKGLVDDINKGKDMKAGYRFDLLKEPLVEISGLLQNNFYQLVKCYRVGETTPFAIAVRVSTTSKVNAFYCVPGVNADANIIRVAKQTFLAQLTNATAAQVLFGTLQIMVN